MTKIINLIGAPSSGKSVLRAYLYNRLKIESSHSIEEVTEFAKDLVYENPSLLKDQFYVTAEQNRRIHRLVGKVDVVVNDSPIILGAIYNDSLPPIWDKFLADTFKQYDNINFLLMPGSKFESYGIVNKQTEIVDIHNKITSYLYAHSIEFVKHANNNDTYEHITKVINE